MVIRGRVQEGVVVLDNGIRLPEGEVVTVLAPETARAGAQTGSLPSHSVLDIPPVSVGVVLRPMTSDDDLLGEMLEDRS